LLIVMLWLDIWTELNKGLFSEWDLTMAPMRQLMVSTLGIWTLQTHLALDKSILTMLIIHGIGNLTQIWSLIGAELIRETSPACIHSIRGLSLVHLVEINGYGHLDIGTLDIHLVM